MRRSLPLLVAALCAAPAGAQILDGAAAPNTPVGPGIEARAGVPSIVGDAPVSLPRPTTLGRLDATSDTRCKQDGRGRTAVRSADGQVHCVDRSQVGKLR